MTYEQADKMRFTTKESFKVFIVDVFNQSTTGKAHVQKWVVSEEFHADGAPHYHACQLSG